MALISPLRSLGGSRTPLFGRSLIGLGPETGFLNGAEPDTGFLSGVGRFFDVGLGAAFIRNILAGEGAAAAQTLPLIGLLTAPGTNYAPTGRELLDQWLGPGDWGRISGFAPGFFGEPGSGALIEKFGFWDWTGKGVAGLATEVLLDPTMFLGIGALTKPGRALKAAGSSANAKRIILQSGTAEGLANLNKLERSILPTLLKLDGKLPLELLPTFAEQAKAGQRALFAFDVPFTSIATPLVRGTAAFAVFGRAGKYLRGTVFGEAFLKRPGSATGNVVADDFSKTFVQLKAGLEAGDVAKIEEAGVQLTNMAKVLLHPDELTPEKIEEFFLSWLTASEMSDVYKRLPKAEQEMSDVLRGFADDFFERDIVSGVNLTPLDDLNLEQIDNIARTLAASDKDFAIRAGDVFGRVARESLSKKMALNIKIRRRILLGRTGVGEDFIGTLDSMTGSLDEIERAVIKPGQAARISSQIKTLTAKAGGLDEQFNMLIRQFRDEAGKVKLTGRKTALYNRLESSIQAIGDQLDSTVNRLNNLTQLGETKAIRSSIKEQAKKITDMRAAQRSLKVEREVIGGLDDLLEPVSPSRIEAETLRKVTQAGFAVARQSAKKESAYLDQLIELGNRIVDEAVPESEIALQLGRLAPEAPKAGPAARQLVEELTETITNLNKTNLTVDDYVTHVPTLAARELIEKQFPDQFRGATYEWRFDHASTLRRKLPGSIAELNERFRPALGGADFFTTDPGIILATRAARTSTAETISQFSEGALRMRNVGMDALESFDDALRQGATLGTTPKEILAGALEFGADLPKRQVDALENIRNVLNESGDVIGKDGLVSKAKYQAAVADLDNLIRRHSDGKLGLPRDKQMIEVWRRKKLTPKVFDVEVADGLDLMMGVFRGDPTVVGNIPRWFQKVTRPWKVAVLLPWPQYHARNFYSEWFLNFLAGMRNPAKAGEMAWRSMNVIWAESRRRGLTKAGKAIDAEVWAGRLREMKFKTRDGVIDGTELIDQFRRLGLDEGFRRSELNMLLSPTDQVSQLSGMNKSKGFIRKFAQEVGDTGPGRVVKAGGGALAKFAMASNTFVERHPRLAQFIWELEDNGRSLREAGLEVVKRHYSYNALSFTRFENQIRATAMPFFSWTRNNVPAMVREFVKFPRRGAVVAKLFGKADFTDEELQAMPKWVRDSVKIRTSKKGVITRIGLPFEDIMEWWSDPTRKIFTSLHPAAQAAIEFRTGRRVFSDRPIAQDTLFRGVRLPNAVEILGNAALGRFASAGRKLQDISSGKLGKGEFGFSFFLGPKLQQFDPEEAEFNQLREQISKLQDEGILKSFEVPFAPKDDERVTPEIRELVKRFRAAAKQRSQRRRNQ